MSDFLTFLGYFGIFLLLLVLSQDIHIFPGAFFSKLKGLRWKQVKLPPRVHSFFMPTPSGHQLEVWHYTAERQTELSGYRALVFHGNGGPLEQFIFVQMWLGQLGICSYSFDYRGFGRSSGWPSERNMYEDSDTFWKFVNENEHIHPERLIVVGISIGSAPAARIAAKLQARLLVLSSAFTDLRSTVQAQPVIGLLAPCIWHRFPTKHFVSELRDTELVLCVGNQDRIVPPAHTQQIAQAYQGNRGVHCLSSDIAGHNLAFFALKDELEAILRALPPTA